MNREWVWGYREDEPMGGQDPYSNSKSCAELVTTAYRESYFPRASFEHHGVAVASARAGNAIGGGDWTSDQLIPDLMRAFLVGAILLDSKPVCYPALAVRPGAVARISHAC
jgi:CDP-glucose 4,6-dehydratase